VLELLDAGLPTPAVGAFTTRSGGAGTGAYASANLAGHVGDDPRRVAAERRALAAQLGLEPGRLTFAGQVHGRGVVVVDAPVGTEGVPDVDALVTTTPGLGLVVLAADCLPVLLADPTAGVVAAVHAGRQGLVAGVLQEALRVMTGLGAVPARTLARIGPAVCGRCYQLPPAMVEEVAAAVPDTRATTRLGGPSADLPAGAEAVLRAAGVVDVVRVGGCTVEQPERFYSYRRDGVTGRHAAVVRLLA